MAPPFPTPKAAWASSRPIVWVASSASPLRARTEKSRRSGCRGGTNSKITCVRFAWGFRISFTGMQVLKHDGTPHHGVGIHPTVPASRTVRGIATGHDELLEKAMEVGRQPA